MSENAKVTKLTGLATVHVDESGQKAIRPGDGGTVATFVMSSMSADRDMERIDPNGWKVPDGNINVLVDHCYEVENVVGKIVRTWTDGDKYLADVLFADTVAENTLAKFVVGMLKAGFLGPVSVGFMPLKWNDPDGKTYTRENPGPYWGPLPGRMYVEQELLELSMVAVGSNRDAMLVGMRAFGLVNGAAGVNTAPTSDPTSGPAPDEAIVVELKNPESWLTKYLRPAKDSSGGAALSRECFDRLTEAKTAMQSAMDACDMALQSAESADSTEAA